MAWNAPRTWSPGETVTAALLNAQLRDNSNVLKTRIRDDGLPRAVKFAKSDAGSSNTNAAETDLAGFTFQIAAGELAAVGDGYVLEGQGALAANGNTKTLRIDIAGQKLILLQTTLTGYFAFRVRLTYYSATTVRLTGVVTTGAAAGTVAATSTLSVVGSIAALNLAIAQTFKMTGQGTASNDITLLELTARYALV